MKLRNRHSIRGVYKSNLIQLLSSSRLKAIFIVAAISLCPGKGFAHGDSSHVVDQQLSSPPPAGHHGMTHPFLSHMALPDEPGEVGIRVTPIQRAGAMGSSSDFAVHVEAGIVKNLGLHIRNDAVNGAGMGQPGQMMEDHGTELMLMYTLLHNDDNTRGLSVFGQTSWPTVKGDGPPIRGAAGLGVRWSWTDSLAFDGDVHLDPSTPPVEGEYEGSLQFRFADGYFAILEDRGNFGGTESRKNYILPAIKVALGKSPGTFGVGLQFPTTVAKDYDRQAMFQIDWAFE
jgi:hypothetical protein